MDNTAVRANRHIDSRLLIICIPGFGYINEGGSLSSSDSLLLTGNTDSAAADTYLYKICSGLCQKTETFSVYDISGTYFYCISVVFPDIVYGQLLPLRKAFGTVLMGDRVGYYLPES